MKKIIIIIWFLFFRIGIIAQDSSKLNFSAYAEVYHSFELNNDKQKEKPSFIYNHKRLGEVNINLAYAKVNYTDKKTRANLALMVGNYAQYNLAAEPNLLKNIFEANIGIKLSKQKNIWLDAGIMPSHIGFESAISKDCWTLTRSLLAENSPYFETGTKLSYISNKENFTAAILLLNGWQRIQKPNGMHQPSFGLQLNYKPNIKLTLNYSNFLGSDKPDSLKATRTYHNFYAIYDASAKIGITAGVDVGTEQNKTWVTPIFIARYKANTKHTIVFRSEYFKDEKQALIATNTPNGFQVFGMSLGYDYTITNNCTLRVEIKNYNSKDAIFTNNSKTNTAITSSLSIGL
jgi:hypothetical protein